ncbi:MAG: radical SAM protein, partial [Candidatus Electrothrix sp. ATG1]|nr:radical SAM protein [Candidatus Electrothrix sp. ATG1]
MKNRDNTELSNGIIENDFFYPAKLLPSGTLRIVLTTNCNFLCKYCFREGEREGGRTLSKSYITTVLKSAKKFGIKSVKLTGGEPLLYTDILCLINEIKQLGIEYIDLTTNASLLNEDLITELNNSKLNAITLSLDSLIPKKISYLTGYKKPEKVLKNIELACRAFNGSIRLNWIVLKDNFDETDNIIKFC